MMMPPKKSKAARGVAQAESETKEGEKNTPERANGQASPQDDGQDKSDKHVNIFEETVVEGKRKRLMPIGEQKLNDWLSEHFEEKENSQIALGSMYNTFIEYCANTMNAFTVDEPVFMKIVKARFPKGYCVKEDSLYRASLKEKKATKPAPKVQADSLKLKMRDIITKAIQDLGNPSKGLRFSVLKNHLAMRYPALRLDLNPGQLLKGLFVGVRAGYVERVRGIGKMGVYRLPGPALIEEKVPEKKKSKKDGVDLPKEQTEGDAAVDGEAGAEADGSAAAGDKESEGDKDKKKKKPAKRKKKDAGESAADDAAGGEKGEGDAAGEDKKKSEDEGKAKKKKKKSTGSKKPPPRKFTVHSDPQRVEECFQLAFTYMTEPKESSVNKIQKYIAKYYPRSDLGNLKSVMESGIDSNYWELVRGSVGSGTFRLLLDEVDCTADDDMVGQVCNAIMATTEPKVCSALLLKRYVMDYHPNLNVADRPHLFKRALEKNTANGNLRQLSGIGAMGSFQLEKPFVPKPVILAGRDTAKDHEGESVLDEDNLNPLKYADAYMPRPTKMRGKGRDASKEGKFVLQGDFDEPVSKKVKTEKLDEADAQLYYDAYVPRPTSRGLGRGPPGSAPLITKAAKKVRPEPKETKRGPKKGSAGKKPKAVAAKQSKKGKGKRKAGKGKKK